MKEKAKNSISENLAQASGDQISDILLKVFTGLSDGMVYVHNRIHENTKKSLEAASFLYALIELLDEKKLLSIPELEERKKQVAERLVSRFLESGMGLMHQNSEYDKYHFEHTARVDCENSLSVCRAICCKLPFALSKQDVEEGIIRWDFGRPYLIAHDTDGYCVHLDRQTYGCTAHEHRPVACRGFDCRSDAKWKLWLDYDKKILNQELIATIEEGNARAYIPNKTNF